MSDKSCRTCGKGKGHYRCGDCRPFHLDNWEPKVTEWQKQSNRDTVKTLLAIGFIPTWLEKLLDYGDLMELQAEEYTVRALKAESSLRNIARIVEKISL
jgi:hypothetical protein